MIKLDEDKQLDSELVTVLCILHCQDICFDGEVSAGSSFRVNQTDYLVLVQSNSQSSAHYAAMYKVDPGDSAIRLSLVSIYPKLHKVEK